MLEYLSLLQLFCTTAMVGLIWFVQFVHYPLFGYVDATRFIAFEQSHQQRTTVIVAPLMITEALLSLVWLWWRPEGTSLVVAVVGVLLVAVIWLSTLLLQVPAHGQLAKGNDAQVHRRLVRSNWIRTFAWTIRGGLLIWVAANR